MQKTPRFVVYKNKDGIFVIHMYQPRFVGKLVNKTIELYEQWDDDTDEFNTSTALKKMQKWYFFSFLFEDKK